MKFARMRPRDTGCYLSTTYGLVDAATFRKTRTEAMADLARLLEFRKTGKVPEKEKDDNKPGIVIYNTAYGKYGRRYRYCAGGGGNESHSCVSSDYRYFGTRDNVPEEEFAARLDVMAAVGKL
jgi:hypothetical protein